MKFTLQYPIETLSGKTKTGAGLVASNWRGVNVFRENVIPANPQSTEQVAIRSYMAIASKLYKTCSKSQVAGWAALAALMPVSINGKKITLPAPSIFNSVACWAQVNADTPSLDAPQGKADTVISDISDATFAHTTGTFGFNITASGHDLTDCKVAISISPTQGNKVVLIPSGKCVLVNGANHASIKALTASSTVLSFVITRNLPTQSGFLKIKLVLLSEYYVPSQTFEKVVALTYS